MCRARALTEGPATDGAATGIARLAVDRARRDGPRGTPTSRRSRGARARWRRWLTRRARGSVVLDPDRAATARGAIEADRPGDPERCRRACCWSQADRTELGARAAHPRRAGSDRARRSSGRPHPGRADVRRRLGGARRAEGAAGRGPELGRPGVSPARRAARRGRGRRPPIEMQRNPSDRRVKWLAICACRERAVLEADGRTRAAGRGGAERAIHRYGRLVIMAGAEGEPAAGGAGGPGCARRAERGRAPRAGRAAAPGDRRVPPGEGQPAAAGRGLEHGGLHQRGADAAQRAGRRRAVGRADQQLPRGLGRRRHRHRAGADRRAEVHRRGGGEGGRRGAERPRLARHGEPARRDLLLLRHPEREPDDRRRSGRGRPRGALARPGDGRARVQRRLERGRRLRRGHPRPLRDAVDLLRLLHQVPARPLRLREHRRAAGGHGLQQRRLGPGQHRPGVRARDRAHLRLPGRVRRQRLQLRRRLGPLRARQRQLRELRRRGRGALPDEGQHLRGLRLHAGPPRLGAAARGAELRLRRRRLAGRHAPADHGRHQRRRPRRHRRLRRPRRLGVAGAARRAASRRRSSWSTTSATTPAAGGSRTHPRFMADTTGDGRADIVGFGNAGVYVSRAPGGRHLRPGHPRRRQLRLRRRRLAGEQHPRFVADINGDGRADIVGFGNAGVYVSRAQADGSYGPVTRVVDNFGYDAGGWRVESHPRFLADTTGSGRLDIVGFGNAGVWVSRAQAGRLLRGAARWWSATSATTPAAGGSSSHPRFVADINGDGRADIVGFGNAGVYVSLAQADGSYGAGHAASSTTSATTPAAGGSRATRASSPTPPATAGSTSSASATPGSGCRGRSPAAATTRRG